jgi:transcription elongation factor Elf1
MSNIETFFRTCPACGRRFEVRLTRKAKLSEQSDLANLPRGVVGENDRGRQRLSRTSAGRALLDQGVPAVVDEQEFQYEYECKHCGHRWAEIRATETGLRTVGYSGD